MSIEKAYAAANLAVRERYATQKPHFLECLNKLNASHVSIFTGAHDHVQNIFNTLKVKFALDPAKINTRMIIANCAGHFDTTKVKNMVSAVKDGATLITSDWSLSSVVEKGFPGFIRRKPGPNSGDEVVSVEPFSDSIWAEISCPGADPQW